MNTSSDSAPAVFAHGNRSSSASRPAGCGRRSLAPGRWAQFATLGLLACLAALDARAQDAIAPLPQEPVVPQVLRDANPGSDQSQIGPVGGSLLTYGPVNVHANLLYRYMYDQGLRVSGQQVNTASHTIAPGINMDLGTHWSLAYDPSWTFYQSQGLRNTVSQSVSAQGAEKVADWGVQVSENYTKSTPLLIETAQQTDLRDWSTMVSATHDIGDQFQFQASGGMDARYGSNTPDVRNWSGQLWLSKAVDSALSLAIGPSYGYEDISQQPNQQYERYSGRIDWQLSEKVKLHLQGGWEDRQILSTVRKTLRNPNVDGSLDYRPFEATSVSFTTSRSTDVSYLSNQITDATRWGVNLSQRLLLRYFLSAGYNHQRNSYTVTSGPLVVDRVDKNDSYNLRLTTSLFDHWTVAAAFTDNKNASSAQSFGFASKQYSLELNCRY